MHGALFGAVALVNIVGIATDQYDNDDTPISESRFKQAVLATTILATLGSSLINRAINNRLDDKALQLERISELQHNMAHPYPTPELRKDKGRSWAVWGREQWDYIAQGASWVGRVTAGYARVGMIAQEEQAVQDDAQMAAMEAGVGWRGQGTSDPARNLAIPSDNKQPLGHFTRQEAARERSNSAGGKEDGIV